MAKNTTPAPVMGIKRTDQQPVDDLFPTAEQLAARQQEQTEDPQPQDQTAPKQTRSGRYRNQRTDTNDGRTQATFKLPAELVEQVRAIAYWERVEQWQIVADALREAVSDYETKHGKVKTIPKR